MGFKTSACLLTILTTVFMVMVDPSPAQAKSEIYKNWRGIAIKGYDPVAFHKDGKPIKSDRPERRRWKLLGAA